jgi:hypothetical protein
MINLLPHHAKRELTKEYWLRAVTVWFFLWAITILVGIILLVPPYLLISLQTAAYKQSAESATQKNESFDSVAAELTKASEQASAMSDHFVQPAVGTYLELLKQFENDGLSITQINLERTAEGVLPIKVGGVAKDRQALAGFREAMLADERIESVELPISNLAKDKDIIFDVVVTITNGATYE